MATLTNWNDPSIILRGITAAIILGSVLVLRRQLRIQAFYAATERLQKETVRDARKFVFQELAEKPMPWTDSDKEKARLVCSTYDSAAQFLKHLGLKESLLIDEWADSIRRAWTILRPYVEDCRKEIKWDYLFDDFERLGRATNDYFYRLPD